MKQPFGKEVQIDLYNCDAQAIRSEKRILDFVIQLCDLIKMRRYGDAHIVRFGDEGRVYGYSMFQLIETSNVSGHFAEETNSAYINIFSCKDFDKDKALDFCKKFFYADTALMKVAVRK